MKKSVVIIALLLFFSKISIAQLSYNYSNFSIGAGGGLARASADLAKETNKYAFFINGNYNLSPFTTLTAELQIGKLAGGDPKSDQHTRAFVNSYKAILFYTDLQLGEYIDYRDRKLLNVLKNFYAGTGFGAIHNQMSFVQRTSLNNPGYIFPGEDSSTELMLPVRLGYEFKFYDYYHEPKIRLSLTYQQNWVYGEGLDGYNDPPGTFKNYHVDRYSLFSVGLRYGFGIPISYRKPIRSF